MGIENARLSPGVRTAPWPNSKFVINPAAASAGLAFARTRLRLTLPFYAIG
jgi:hypothetical protein